MTIRDKLKKMSKQERIEYIKSEGVSLRDLEFKPKPCDSGAFNLDHKIHDPKELDYWSYPGVPSTCGGKYVYSRPSQQILYVVPSGER